ncbi:unnamed protein product [Umbelopsis vinacea]
MSPSATESLPVAWSEIVRRGQELKIPAARSRPLTITTAARNVPVTVFEAEGYAHQRRSKQAEHILKRALHADTVLFELNAEEIVKDDVYDLLTKEIGEATGFRPIHEYQGGQRGNLLIEAKFVDPEHVTKACQQGVTIKGIQYYATPSIDVAERDFVKVNLSHLPLENRETLKEGLLQSIGYFEGEGTVILDVTSPAAGTHYESLMRMLYLAEWDNYFLASFEGAPPVCYMCRLTGHIKKGCPEMANFKCYKCQETGHMRRDCPRTVYKPRGRQSAPEDIDNYISATQKTAAQDKDRAVINQAQKAPTATHPTESQTRTATTVDDDEEDAEQSVAGESEHTNNELNDFEEDDNLDNQEDDMDDDDPQKTAEQNSAGEIDEDMNEVEENTPLKTTTTRMETTDMSVFDYNPHSEETPGRQQGTKRKNRYRQDKSLSTPRIQ